MIESGGDLALLRRFEPVVRSTSGDKFYPMDVEPYVRACSLWVKRPGESDGSCGRGEPGAGTFVNQYAVDLARNAGW